MNDLQAYLIDEFIEEYEDGALSRADLEHRVRGMLGDAGATELLASVPQRSGSTRPRVAAIRPIIGGAELETMDVQIALGQGELEGYLARPTEYGSFPAIVAIHENRGLVEHTRDCARRLASEGYIVLAPDLLSRQGGTSKFPDPNDAIAALGQSDPEQNAKDLVAALDWLTNQPDVNGGLLGVTGWCMGGGYTWRVATMAGSRIRAAVPWYGPNPPSGVENIAAPVFAIYGALDERINAGIDDITQKMSAAGKTFEKKIYPGAQHAFNNDTNAERYNAEQAPIAWNDMLAFFKRHLSG
ncbi:MAG TPA: dienelactone hydrolase family protein [Chloroflexota bacterium]|jgi:carboxymethylenebutenolidase|nr:dienelactone hydrolase family protein [Chloroflexota bacterium]